MTQNNWYYALNNDEKGPVSNGELFLLLKNRHLPFDTLVWCKGMDAWQPASDTPDFSKLDELPPPLPGPSAPAKESQKGTHTNHTPKGPPPLPSTYLEKFASSDSTPSGTINDVLANKAKPHPWRRYFARIVDHAFVLICSFIIAVGLVTSLMLITGNQKDTDYAWIGLPFIVSLFTVEAAFLSTFGNTPGKWLFNIKLTTLSGGKLTFWGATLRVLHIFFRGFGLHIPIVNLFCLTSCYHHLSTNGTIYWDKDKYLVSHKPITAVRWVMCTLITVVSFCILIAVNIAIQNRS